MFKIYDGREKFYQWDLDRKLIVEDPQITEVHFCNRTGDCSLVCETFVEDGITMANVPNILLQTDWKIHVYAYDGTYTKHKECYEVVSRTKPADYIYTETEILNWNVFETRVNETVESIESMARDAYYCADDATVTAYAAENMAWTASNNAADALQIAKGANHALTFEDYRDMCECLLQEDIMPGNQYPIGNVILIRKLSVPDLYFYDSVEEYFYNFPSETAILEALNTVGYIDVGYCRLAQLETQKVDMSDYAKKEQVPTVSTVLKDNGAYTLTITKGVE